MDNFPVLKWRKGQFQSWLKENKVPFRLDALRLGLWMLCKIHRAEKTSKVSDKIAERYGHEVLSLPPYHCDSNEIESTWDDEKNFVARENNEMILQSDETLLRKRREEIIAEICENCVEHVKQVENFYWKTD